MAALQSSGAVGLDGSLAWSSPVVRELRSAGQCHFSGSVRLGGAGGWTSRAQPSLVVKAEEGNSRPSFGTQFFKAGGKKSQTISENDAPPARGTQLFRLGKKKPEVEEEEQEEEKPGNLGTQLFSIGGKKKPEADATAIVPKEKGTLALQSLQFGRGRRVDPRTVFVAGSTGQIGARIAQQLLRAGFVVRGGVPDLYVAQQLAEFATQYGVISRDEAKRLNAVEFDYKNVTSIAKALGNAAKVVVTVGPTEDGPRAKVTASDALRVLEAATVSNATHFVLVSDPAKGVAADNGPLSGITSFFSGLFKRSTEVTDAEVVEKIVESGLTYTIIKAGSTDGVDDYAPELGNLVIEAEGASDPSAKVSKIQVASVVAGVLSNTAVSENKVVEVTSSPFAASRPVDELISAIPVDNRRALREEEKARLESEENERAARLKAEAEAQAAVEEARKAAALAAQLEAEARKLAQEEARAAAVAAKAQARAEAAAASVDGLQAKAQELGGSPLQTIGGRLGQKVSFKLDQPFGKRERSTSSKATEAATEKPSKTQGFSFPSFPTIPKSEPKPKQPPPPPKPARARPAAAAAAASPAKSSGFLDGFLAPKKPFM